MCRPAPARMVGPRVFRSASGLPAEGCPGPWGWVTTERVPPAFFSVVRSSAGAFRRPRRSYVIRCYRRFSDDLHGSRCRLIDKYGSDPLAWVDHDRTVDTTIAWPAPRIRPNDVGCAAMRFATSGGIRPRSDEKPLVME